MPGSTQSQWIFPVHSLQHTPSRLTSNIPLEKELYDRARGVEFLFRLGVSLALPSCAMYTAATWFHRFYMRYSMEDYHRQDVAASCIFLATKTEECGRKLRDVAKIFCSKVSKTDPKDIPDDSREVEEAQTAILLTEEVLLEALCFDFVVESPQKDLVELFEGQEDVFEIQECAWSLANDSYRTPLCVLYPPNIVAAACYILAQHLTEDPQTASLAERIASPAPSASLPTPPTQHPLSSQSARYAVEYFKFNEVELSSLGEAIAIILEFYAAQDTQGSAEYLASIASIPPPISLPNREALYVPFSHAA
ncbi:cyclin-like protein, partial [Cristinia sonorae]